jgi:hypothetical protein
MRDRERIARLQECRHVKYETGPVQGKGRGGACLSIFRYASFVARMERSEIRGGIAAGMSLPDYASLHPGYEEK